MIIIMMFMIFVTYYGNICIINQGLRYTLFTHSCSHLVRAGKGVKCPDSLGTRGRVVYAFMKLTGNGWERCEMNSEL